MEFDGNRASDAGRTSKIAAWGPGWTSVPGRPAFGSP